VVKIEYDTTYRGTFEDDRFQFVEFRFTEGRESNHVVDWKVVVKVCFCDCQLSALLRELPKDGSIVAEARDK
jgi:hypothetical protein